MNSQELMKNDLLLCEVAVALDEALNRTATKQELFQFLDYLTRILVKTNAKEFKDNLDHYANRFVGMWGL